MIDAATLMAVALEHLREKAPDLFQVLDALELTPVDDTYEYTDANGETQTGTIETISVSDKGHLYYNPTFMIGADDDLRLFGLGVVGLMFQTNMVGRRGDRDVRAWGIAANICAVEWLRARGFTVPEIVPGADAWGITFDAACTPEEVYRLLPSAEKSEPVPMTDSDIEAA